MAETSLAPLLACVFRELAPARAAGSSVSVPPELRRAAETSRRPLITAELPRTRVVLATLVENEAALVAVPRALGVAYAYRPGDAWRRLTPRALAELVRDELGVATGDEHGAAFVLAVLDHARVTQVLSSSVPRAALPRSAWLASEQAPICHPAHPSPKSRIGMTEDEVRRYSPELGAAFPLRWILIRRERVHTDSAGPVSGPELMQRLLGEHVEDGFVALPVHPHQAARLSARPSFRLAKVRDEIRDLGERRALFAATSSVRTVVPWTSGPALKLPLDVTITNSVRDNPVAELEAALAVTRLVRALPPSFHEGLEGFRLVEEPAFVTARLAGDDPDPSLGVMIREDVRTLVGDDATLHLAAAGFGSGAWGQTEMDAMIGELATEAGISRGEAREVWWHRYATPLVKGTLALYLEEGILTEPHLQNVLWSSGDARGDAVQVFLRDFDNCKLVVGGPAWRRSGNLAARVHDELRYDEHAAWKRLAYCLFVNHLGEATATLARGDRALERRLWTTVHGAASAALQRARDRGARPEALAHVRELLRGAPLPAKANLRTRMAQVGDKEAPYVLLRSPLLDPS